MTGICNIDNELFQLFRLYSTLTFPDILTFMKAKVVSIYCITFCIWINIILLDFFRSWISLISLAWFEERMVLIITQQVNNHMLYNSHKIEPYDDDGVWRVIVLWGPIQEVELMGALNALMSAKKQWSNLFWTNQCLSSKFRMILLSEKHVNKFFLI